MIPTYVFGWPTGQEQGDYLAVDLGKLRLCTWKHPLICVFFFRWDQPARLSRHPYGRRKIRAHSGQVSP